MSFGLVGGKPENLIEKQEEMTGLKIKEIPEINSEIIKKDMLDGTVDGFQKSFDEIAKLKGDDRSKFVEVFLFRLENAIGHIKYNQAHWVAQRKRLVDIRKMLSKSLQ